MYEDIKTACLYVRFSSHNQTEQSIEGQTRVCQEFCQRHNIKIVEIYADRATSASKNTEKRVSFLKMIKDSEKGLFDAVVVYKLDRFARSRYDSATYKYRLKKNGVQLISATENITNSPEGIILESVLEGMAEFYSAELSQKINRGMRESAYKHNSIGGALPLGYKTVDKKLVIDEKTAPIVREAFTMYAEGHSVAEICRIFNARGYKTSKGTEFGKNSFSKIFRNERYIGTYTYHDYRAEDAIPAIIDRDLWDRVQLRLKKVKNSPGRNKAKRVYLLSGKLFCGHCGESMNGNCNGNKYAFYECYGKKSKYNGCQKRNLRKEYIERLIAQDALSLLTDENIEHLATVACERNDYEIETGSPIPVIRDRIHQTEVSINNLTKAIETGATPDALVKRMVELEREKKDLSTQLKKEEELIVPLEKEQVIFWLEKFKDGDIEDEEFCRLLIDLFVNSVTVWDEDNDMLKVTIAYNLTSLPTKTYRLTKDGTLSDFTGNAPALRPRPDRLRLPRPRRNFPEMTSYIPPYFVVCFFRINTKKGTAQAHCTSVSVILPFHAAERNTADNVFGKNQIDYDDRKYRKRDHHIDLAHIKLQEVRTAQLGNQNRNGFPLGITDNQRRGEIVVPRFHKGKDGLHRDSGLQDRQDDHIEGVELARAINASCLNQFLRQAGIHVLLHEKEHSRCRNAGQNQRPQRIGQVHIVHQAKETQRRYLHRHRHNEQDDGKCCILELEVVGVDCVCRQRAEVAGEC